MIDTVAAWEGADGHRSWGAMLVTVHGAAAGGTRTCCEAARVSQRRTRFPFRFCLNYSHFIEGIVSFWCHRLEHLTLSNLPTEQRNGKYQAQSHRLATIWIMGSCVFIYTGII